MPRGLGMKSPMITPRGPHHRSSLPNALRAAARAIVDEAGPDGVGLGETARRVGVSAMAASRHFANTEDAGRRELADESFGGECGALIGIENPRLSETKQRLLQRRRAKSRIVGVRQPPCQNRSAGPVDDRHQIEEAARHRDVGHVGRPHVVRLDNLQAAQQVGVYLVPGRGFARAGARNQRLDPHHPHQPLHPLAVDPTAFFVELEGHSPRAVERKFEMQFVDVAHHRQIVRLGVRDLLASVAAEGFRELAAAIETGAIESDRLGGVGLAYFDFALQKRDLFRLMFGSILVERARYPELNEAASAVFGLLRRVAVSADEWPCEDDVAGMAAWGLVMACSTPSSPRLAQEVAVCRSLVTH